MSRSPASVLPSEQRELPFVYVGGDPSLDLVNTIDWLDEGTENERLTSYAGLTRWAEGAGVVSRREAQQLRQRGLAHKDEADAVLAHARSLRLLLKRLFHGIDHGAVSDSVWREFDTRLAEALSQLTLAAVAPGERHPAVTVWQWREADRRLEWLLWPVIWSAARLLTSREAHRVRVCDGPGCGWVFVDRSRNHLRRWCQMETCGTAAKTRRRRARQHNR